MYPPYENRGEQPQWVSPGRYIPALIVICIGVAFLLANLHLVVIEDIWRYWPAILLVAGGLRMANAPTGRERTGGAIMFTVGGLFMVDALQLLPMSVWTFWPVLLIGLGIFMLVDREFSGSRPFRSFRNSFGNSFGNPHTGRPRESAVFSGGRRVFSGAFTGAKFEVCFGGFDIDLRAAEMVGDSAIFKIDAVFGGAEIKVPESWLVDVRADGVFGAVTDSTRHPNPTLYPNPKTLIVKGAAVFGGVEIKN